MNLYETTPRPACDFEVNGHKYSAFIMRDRGMNTSIDYYTVSYKDAAGKVVSSHRSKSSHTAHTAAKKKATEYGVQLVSSPAQSVSDADMAKAAATAVEPGELIALELAPSYRSIDLQKLQGGYQHNGDAGLCILCGRELGKSSKSVHLSWFTCGLMNTDNGEHPHSQGFFGIGSECAKRLPKAFIF